VGITPWWATTLVIAFLTLARTAAAQSSGVHDDFNRSDAASLGIATSGHAWSSHGGPIGVAGGLAVPGFGFYLASIDAGEPALNVAVSVVQPAVEFWLVLRFADAQNYWRFGRWGGQGYVLQQIVNNGLGTPVIDSHVAPVPQSGDSIKCKVRSTFLECRVNGVLVSSTSDASLASATRVGLSGYQGSDARFDDFRATPPTLADLSATITGPTGLDFGSEGVWQVTVSNVGVLPAGSVELVVTPPASVSNVTIPGGFCGPSGSIWRCVVGTLSVNQVSTIFVHATAPSSITTLNFSATAISPFPEDDNTNNSASAVATTRQPPPPGAIAYDDFNRTNGAIGNAYTGQAWTAAVGAVSVLDGTAAFGSGFVLGSIDSGQSRGDLSLVVTTPSPEFWAVLRFSDSSNYWRFGRWNGEAYHLQKISANAATLYPRLATVNATAGDVVRCVYWLDQIDCSVNGATVARAIDPFNESATRVGLSAYQSPSTRFDELLVKEPPPRADVGVTVTGPTMVRSGQSASWTVTYRNRGTTAVTGAELLIASAPLSNPAFGGGACFPQGSQYRCALGSVAPGAVAVRTVTGIAPAAPAIIHVAASTAAVSGESETADNTSSFNTQVRPAIPSNALLIDLFDRANSATGGVADTGQLWSNHAGGIGIQSSEAFLQSGFTLSSVDAGVASGDVSVSVPALSTEFWLILRLADAQNYWRFGRSAGGSYVLQQIAGNQIGNPSLQLLNTVQPAPGDQIACRINTLGIDCAVNNTAVVRTTDTFNRTATRVGLGGYHAGTARFDDLVMVHVPSGPDLSVSALAPGIGLTGQPHIVRVIVRNNGDSIASPITMTVALTSIGTVTTIPSGCWQSGSAVSCPLSASLAPGGSEQFNLSVSATTSGQVTGVASAPLISDAFASDNSASWSTSIAAAGTGVFDAFTRPDTASGLGTSLTGETWQTLSGVFRIQNGEARGTTPGSLARIDGGFAFGSLEVVLGDSPEAAVIAFRIVDANNYYRLRSSGGYYRITKVINGAETDVQYYIQRYATVPQAGDLVRVVSRPDDGMFVAVNGRHIIDAGDQQFMHATGWGLGTIGSSASYRSFALRRVIEGFATVDAFNGFNGSWLQTPTTGVNYHWLTWLGAPFEYVSGAARASVDSYTVATLDTSSERATASVRLVQQGSGGWLVFRYVENGPYFRFGFEGSGPYAVSYAEGAYDMPLPVSVQTLATLTPQPGDLLEVRQTDNGEVTCLVNGVLTHRFTYSSGAGFRSTLIGLAALDHSARFDDLTITPLPR
jgi:hypothetical protein